MSESELTVEQLITRLGFARLEQIAGPDPSTVEITGVVGVDEHAQVADGRGLLVLGIGLEDAAAVARGLSRWTELGAAALVVRTSLVAPPGEGIGEPGEVGGTTLLGLGEEMSWMRLAAMVAADLDRLQRPRALSDLDASDRHGAGPDDFYAIANSLSDVVGGPITIEDLDSRIIAFSADQDRADEHRKSSILERRVSRAHNAVLEEEGIFARLYASATPIYVVPAIADARPRVAMRIRYGDQTLGSIWAVADQPPSAVQQRALVEASQVIALSIMRRRLLDDARHEERCALVERLVEGGRGAADAAAELSIAGVPAYVMAVTHRTPALDDVDERYQVRALATLLGTFMTSVNRRAVVAPLGGTVYTVVPHAVAAGGEVEPARQSSQHAVEARRFGTNLLQRLAREELVLGIGDLVVDAAQLSRSRQQADAAARVLRHRESSRCDVGYWRDLQVDALLLEMTDTMLARHESLAWPFDRLGGVHEDEQLATVRAYLERFGDVTTAAADVFVHPNTFRYRLRKLAERDGIDLDDPDTRFALMLQLRLHDHRRRITCGVLDPAAPGLPPVPVERGHQRGSRARPASPSGATP